MHVLAFDLADYIRADRSISTLSNVSTHSNPWVSQLSLSHSRLGRFIPTYQTLTQQHPISIHCWFRVSSLFKVNINAGGRRLSSKGFLHLSHWVTRSFSVLRQNTSCRRHIRNHVRQSIQICLSESFQWGTFSIHRDFTLSNTLFQQRSLSSIVAKVSQGKGCVNQTGISITRCDEVSSNLINSSFCSNTTSLRIHINDAFSLSRIKAELNQTISSTWQIYFLTQEYRKVLTHLSISLGKVCFVIAFSQWDQRTDLRVDILYCGSTHSSFQCWDTSRVVEWGSQSLGLGTSTITSREVFQCLDLALVTSRCIGFVISPMLTHSITQQLVIILTTQLTISRHVGDVVTFTVNTTTLQQIEISRAIQDIGKDRAVSNTIRFHLSQQLNRGLTRFQGSSILSQVMQGSKRLTIHTILSHSILNDVGISSSS